MTIAIVTCQELPEPDADEGLLMGALTAAGVPAQLVAWDDPTVCWGEFDAAVLRSPWNYIERLEDFLAWAATTDEQTALWNPLEIVTWNTHKGYLANLAADGVPVVPTAWTDGAEGAQLADIMADRGWTDVVAKPVVGAGSFLTDRITDPSSAQALDFWRRLCANGEVMVQPYLRSVEEYGERSLIWINGALTHAVRKSPRLGDADEQVSDALAIADDERALAEAIITDIPAQLLYARIDLIRDDSGVPLLAELELVEPSLFLAQAPHALARFVDATAALGR